MDRPLDDYETCGPNNCHSTDGKALQTVHVNRLCPLLEPPQSPLSGPPALSANWCPPLFVHGEESELLSEPSSVPPSPPVTTRSGHVVKPVSRYGDPITY